QNNLPARLFRAAYNLDHVSARHQVAINAQNTRSGVAQQAEQLVFRAERGIVDLHAEALLPQVRREIQKAQRRIGLHDLLFLGVLTQEISMRQQELHDLTPPPASAIWPEEVPSSSSTRSQAVRISCRRSGVRTSRCRASANAR